MKTWKVPPVIKIYEALGTLGDARLTPSEDGATVTSSDGAKTYIVRYDAQTGAIGSNDNASFWQGYLGYPGVAYLLHIGKLPHDPQWDAALRDIPWKELNAKYKRDYDKTLLDVHARVTERGFDISELEKEVSAIAEVLVALKPSAHPTRDRLAA